MADSYGEVTGYVTEKRGLLYTVINEYKIIDGVKKRKPKWNSTGLKNNRKNKKLANDILNGLIYQYSNGHSMVQNPNIIVEEYIKKFISSKKRDIADSTYCSYTNKCKYISNYFSKVKVKEITTIDVNSFYDYLLTCGRIKENSCDRGLSVRTVKDVKAILNALMECAKEDGIIAINPCTKSTFNKKQTKKKENKEEDTFFSYQECMDFLKAAKNHELYYLFYFTMYFGLRRGEVLGLSWKNIDFNRMELSLRGSVTKGTKVNRDDSLKTKDSCRIYPLTENQCNILRQIKEKKKQNKKLFGSEYVDSDYIFTHVDGSLYYPDYPTKAFKKIIKKNNSLPQNIHFHGLRTSCVSILVEQNLDIKTIQNWVGHADIETTLKYYTKIKSMDSKKEIATKMDELLPI